MTYTYQIYNGISDKPISVTKSDGNYFSSIPLDTYNTDYQQFKIDMSNGIELYDANNNPMTSEQITEFLNTLP
jgi:hypothetical protein